MANSAVPLLTHQPFRFLDLPSEIRDTIYSLTLFAKPPKHLRIRRRRRGGPPRLALFLVSRRLHDEASYTFYTNQVFRVFSVQDFQPLPTIKDLPRRYRQLVTSAELILGPGWTSPPKDWRVTPTLGLQDMLRVTTLQTFVELDPSHPSLRGFRVSEDYYTNFAGRLVHDVLAAMPSVKYVQIDSNPSVEAAGPLITRLLKETAQARKMVKWGPGPKGRASDSVFVELLSRVEPWLKPANPGRPEDDDLPHIIIGENGEYVLSAVPAPRPIEKAATALRDEEGEVVAGPSASKLEGITEEGETEAEQTPTQIVAMGSGDRPEVIVGSLVSP